MTKKLYKAALLAALGLASVPVVQAATYNHDLIVGFTIGSGTDEMYDLGPESSLTNGESWDLSSLLSGYGSLSGVQWGVIGNGPTTGSPRTFWTTVPVGVTPDTITGNTAFNALNAGATALYGNFATAGAGQSGSDLTTDVANASWYQETVTGPGNTDYVNEYENPNVTGVTSDSFYQGLNTGATPTLIGGFTLASNGMLTFSTVSMAPPQPKITSITRSGSNVSVFFTTTNAPFTYTLYYTNSAGLPTPVASWPSSPTTVTGNGLTNSIGDTTSDATRFYRIGVH